jgi:hypothetical protein
MDQVDEIFETRGQQIFYQGEQVATASELAQVLSGITKMVNRLRGKMEAIRRAFPHKRPSSNP